MLERSPLTDSVAAVSVGIVDGRVVLDLPYEEDHRASVDMNVVMTGSGRFVEVQGTAEGKPFTDRAAAASGRSRADRHRAPDAAAARHAARRRREEAPAR